MSRSPHRSDPFPPVLTLALVLALALAAVCFTAASLWWSGQSYRLSNEPIYDDNQYFDDALSRLRVLNQHGTEAFLNTWCAWPPHSPFSTGLATLAFGVFGLHEYAPYALNGLLVVVLLFEVSALCGRSRLWVKAFLCAFVLSLPFSRAAVVEFRPDFAVGLFGALACWRVLRIGIGPVEPRTFVRYGAISLYTALALLAKPSFFLHSLVILGSSVLLAAVLAKRRAATLTSLGAAVAAGLALAAPYYFFDRGTILQYFLANTGNGAMAKTWRLEGGLLHSLAYYLTGDAGVMLGNFLLPGALIIVAGAVRLAITRQFVKLKFCLAAALISGASFAAISYGSIENRFFGFPFQILFVFLCVYLVADWLASAGTRRAGSIVLIAVILVCGLLQAPFYRGMPTFPDLMWSRPINRVLYRAVFADLDRQPLPAPRAPFISFCTLGILSPHTQHYYALKDGRDLAYEFDIYSDNPDAVWKALERADFVETTELESSATVISKVPLSGIQDQLIQRCLRDPGLRLVTCIDLAKGHAYLFRRVR